MTEIIWPDYLTNPDTDCDEFNRDWCEWMLEQELEERAEEDSIIEDLANELCPWWEDDDCDPDIIKEELRKEWYGIE